MSAQDGLENMIMTNAREEARLPDLLSDAGQQYPHLLDPDALQILILSLERLVRQGKIGMYEEEADRSYDSGSEYRELSVEEIIDIVRRKNNWDSELAPGARFRYHLYLKKT